TLAQQPRSTLFPYTTLFRSVLYEIGEHKPALVAGHSKKFIALLDSSNNRLQWGAMTALNSIVDENAKQIYPALNKIIAAANKGRSEEHTSELQSRSDLVCRL